MKLLFLSLFTTLFIYGSHSQEYVEFVEDFENNDNEWTIDDDEKASSEIKDGSLFLERKETGAYGWWKTIPTNPHHEYSIEASFKHVDGLEDYGYGLLFGRFDWRDYYCFLITSDGSAKIWGKEDDKKKVIKDWQRDINIKPKGQSNVLRITHDGEKTSFYINDVFFHSKTGLTLVGAKTGFKIESTLKVEVEYLKVRYYSEPIKLAKNLATGHKLTNLGDNVNTIFSETSPFITADGKTLYFVSKSNPGNFEGKPDDIWFSNLVDGEWTEAMNMGEPLNNESNNTIISITPDGNKALVTGTYGSSGGGGISMSHKIKGEWQLPEKQTIIGYKNLDRYGTRILSPDGTKLFMSLDDGESYGNTDLYISFLDEDGLWSYPMNMGPQINSFMSDFAPFLAMDGKTFFFSSYGHPGYGSADIFMCKRLDDSWQNWSDPVNLGPEINTVDWEGYYVMSAKADYGFLGASKDDGYGKSDIYSIKVDPAYAPDPVILVKGKVFDSKTELIIQAEIDYENLETKTKEGIAISDLEHGYKIVLPKGGVYGFRAESEGYIAVSQNLDTKELTEFGELEVNLSLVPIEHGQKIPLNNTFFDTGKSQLRDVSILELNRISGIIIANTSLSFEIGGHTDAVGNDGSNKKLSEDRAKAVYDFLISKGVPADRISYKGYGETEPTHENDTEEGKQNNRRVEIKIL